MPATSTTVSANAATKLPKNAAVFLPVAVDGKTVSLDGDLDLLDDDLRDAAQRLVDEGLAGGKATQHAADVVDGTRLILVGTGKKPGELTKPRDILRYAGQVARLAKAHEATKVAVVPPTGASAELLTSGFVLASFDFREHKGTATKDDASRDVKLTVLGGDKKLVQRGLDLALAQNYARTVATRPGNDINPPSLAKEAQKMAKELALSFRVLDHKEADKLGMGGLVGVGQGSDSPPKMIVLGHNYEVAVSGKKKAKKLQKQPLLAIGKAITFDTGGISIKPSAGMESMVFDKCGGMAVLGFMAACAMTNLDRPVVGILAAAENMPSGTAYRPGDILKMHNGVTVEVTNTDAEGRLVLADALSWGIETYQPAACVDLATLTGAAVVALGTSRAGAWSNDDTLFEVLDDASASCGEMIWRMPLGDEYRQALKSNAADLVNSPGRWGGCDTAAEFLHHFVPGNVAGTSEIPWCHLDIAPTADTEKDDAPFAIGATGFGVRTLVAWAERFGR
jgi:leucyl aminopeptidase